MATKKKAPKQRAVNAVPLTAELQESAEKFLQDVHSGIGRDEGRGIALVIIFHPGGNGTVDANVLSTGLADKTRDKMANGALKAISGAPLFYEF